jgi:hypothetical protein
MISGHNNRGIPLINANSPMCVRVCCCNNVICITLCVGDIDDLHVGCNNVCVYVLEI